MEKNMTEIVFSDDRIIICVSVEAVNAGAEVALKTIRPLFNTMNESTLEPVSVFDKNDMLEMYRRGAIFVLELMGKENTIERAFEDRISKAIDAKVEADLDPHGADYGTQRLE